jgi:regulation of enolase protein 1 (concanavalin A-like superfamily)
LTVFQAIRYDSAVAGATGEAVEAFRLQLRKILESRELSSSPQIRQFLSYVSEAAFQNRVNLEQTEIAEHALGKGVGFNPIEDASVRRVATLARQKIQKYYEEAGSNDPVVVTLPVRSYVPVFRFREEIPSADSVPVARRRFWAGALVCAGAGVVGLAAIAWLIQSGMPGRKPAATAGAVEVRTQRGTIENRVLNLPGEGILLGPKIGSNDDVSVRLRFSPEVAYQQAGLIVFQSPDQYIKLGRQFNTRVHWEFGMEEGGKYDRRPGIWSYDPLGQNGAPVWLMIRRRQNVFRAFTSEDGHTWSQVGNALAPAEPLTEARMGVYAFHGQTEAPAMKAHFEQLASGVTFATAAEEAGDSSPAPGWSIQSNCSEGADFRLIQNALSFRFPPRSCIWQLLRPLPAGDCVLTTKLDLMPFSGTIAGLTLEGKRGRVRLGRWPLNGGSIVLQYPPGDQTMVHADYPGNPPVVLRLEVKGGRITGSFSRDEEHFLALPGAAGLDDLGGDLRFGINSQSTSWSQADVLPTARFYYIRQQADRLQPFR